MDHSTLMKPVRKCVCFNCSFSELKEAGIQSVADAADQFGCGTKCGTCIPYIQEMLRTGETAFAVLPLPANR